MMEARENAEIVRYLSECSRRPQKAVQLWAELFTLLPRDSNEVQANRAELAQRVGLRPAEVSEIMTELEAVGAIYRRRDGRGARYFVHPMVATHLKGDDRKRAQAEAPVCFAMGKLTLNLPSEPFQERF